MAALSKAIKKRCNKCNEMIHVGLFTKHQETDCYVNSSTIEGEVPVLNITSME
jgi:hypothetical protein